MSDPAPSTLSYSRAQWQQPRLALGIFVTILLLTIVSFVSPAAVGWTKYRKYTVQLVPGGVSFVMESTGIYQMMVYPAPDLELETGYRKRVGLGRVPVVQRVLARQSGGGWRRAAHYEMPLVPLVVISGLFLLWRIRRSRRASGA